MQINSFSSANSYTRNNHPNFAGKILNTPDLERLKNSLSAMDYVNLNKKIEEIESIKDNREFYFALNNYKKKDVRAQIWEVCDDGTGIPSHTKVLEAPVHQYKWLFYTLLRSTKS